MRISRSRDCIHSSCSGHSSSPSRNRADRHAKRGLVPSRRINCGDWSLPRVRRRLAVRLDLASVRDIAPCAVWPLGGQCGLPPPSRRTS